MRHSALRPPMHLSVVLLSCLLCPGLTAPQRRTQNTSTRFFTGNAAIDQTAWGAALGAGTQYFANQLFNPCRGGNRNRRPTNNRNTASGTNNRIFFGNNAVLNGGLGFAGGYAGASVLNGLFGNPCG